MENDFIKIVKSSSGKNFSIQIYFAQINATINVDLNEADFLQLLLQSAQLYNAETKSVKLQFSEPELNNLIALKYKEEFKKLADLGKKALVRPVAEAIIYIPDAFVPLLQAERITNACGDFMEAMGFELETEDEPVFGSFFKKLRYIFSSTIGAEDLEDLYSKGKKALELKHLELPTAEQTEKLSNAAEKLVKSLEGVEEGVVRCGALIVLKKNVDGKVRLIIQQLSMEMIILLDKKPQLLFNINTVYELLTGDVRGDLSNDQSDTALIA